MGKYDENTCYDWMRLGKIGPITRGMLKSNGFKYDPAELSWVRVSRKDSEFITRAIMDCADREGRS